MNPEQALSGYLAAASPEHSAQAWRASLTQWDMLADVMPINFFLPALLNTAWVIAAIAGVVGRADDCPQTKTHATYQAARWGLFGTFSLSALLQIAIIISGLQGEQA